MESNCANSKSEKMQYNKESFLQSIRIKPDKERLRLLELKRKYDNDEITEQDISKQDIIKIANLYEEEINNIERETNKVKSRIKRMLGESKKKLKQQE